MINETKFIPGDSLFCIMRKQLLRLNAIFPAATGDVKPRPGDAQWAIERKILSVLDQSTFSGGGPTPPPPQPPAAPTNPDILGTSSDGNLIIVWGQASAPSTNEVWKQKNGGGFSLFATVAGGVTQKIDTSAMAVGDLFEYQIRAQTGGLFSAFTGTVGSKKANLFSGAAASISFPTVVFGVGDLRANVMVNLTTYSFPNMHDCTDSAGVISSSVTTYILPNLKTSGAYIQLSGCASFVGNVNLGSLISTVLAIDVSSGTTMSSMNLNSLVTVGDYLAYDNNPNLTSVAVPLLSSVGANLRSFACPALVSIATPSLVSVGGDIQSYNCPVLTSITRPLLNTIGGSLLAYSNPSVVFENFLSLTLVGGTIDFSGNASLTSLAFPVLTTLGGAGSYFGAGTSGIAGSPASSLATVSIPNLIFPDGQFIDFDGCALNAASVNQILRRGVVSGTTISDYELSGGTNAAPTGQGIIDKATLIAAGNTVNTN